ncbi:MAG: GGDEF domain-containing protein [Candidatus Tenebribacter davisii]|nr:GGDEF domain-containing protein [Candidatus Tenebribacter davisii]
MGVYGFYNYKLIIKCFLIFFVLSICLIVFTYRRHREYKEDLDEWSNLDCRLHEYEKKVEKIVYDLPGVAIVGIAKDHTITYWNAASKQLYGFNSKEVIGKMIESLIIPGSSFKNFVKNIDNLYDSDIKIPSGQAEYLHKDKTSVNVLTSFHKYETVFGKQELFNLSIDITELYKSQKELKKSNSKLHVLTRTDSLTQLPNRRAIIEKIDYEILKYERSKEIFAIALISLDNFNSVNDKNGHDCGDFVLKQISNLIVALIRKQDIVGRYSGEEFILLLPQTNSKGALHVTKLILGQIAKFPITYQDKEISLTATIGVIEYDKEETSVMEIIKKADKAMHKGKTKNKNKVIIV